MKKKSKAQEGSDSRFQGSIGSRLEKNRLDPALPETLFLKIFGPNLDEFLKIILVNLQMRVEKCGLRAWRELGKVPAGLRACCLGPSSFTSLNTMCSCTSEQ